MDVREAGNEDEEVDEKKSLSDGDDNFGMGSGL